MLSQLLVNCTIRSATLKWVPKVIMGLTPLLREGMCGRQLETIQVMTRPPATVMTCWPTKDQ